MLCSSQIVFSCTYQSSDRLHIRSPCQCLVRTPDDSSNVLSLGSRSVTEKTCDTERIPYPSVTCTQLPCSNTRMPPDFNVALNDSYRCDSDIERSTHTNLDRIPSHRLAHSKILKLSKEQCVEWMMQRSATEPSKTSSPDRPTIAPSIGICGLQVRLCSGRILNPRRLRILPEFTEGIVTQGKISRFQGLQQHPRQWSPCPAHCNHEHANKCYGSYSTYFKKDSFRCTRCFPGSGTPSGILRVLDCGRAFHRRVRPQHGYGSRLALVPNQLGLHERAQFRRQAAVELSHTGDACAAELVKPLTFPARKDQHNSDVARRRTNDQRKG